MSEWFPAFITESVALGESAARLSLQVPAEVSESFHTPGQYHRVRLESVDNLFAMASRPRSERFEYLVRRHAGLAATFASLPVGSAVHVTRAFGPGFPLELARGRPLLMIATGTGFAPIRSVLEDLTAHGAGYGSAQVLLGVRSEVELPEAEEKRRWAAAGLQVFCTVSRPSPSFRGLVGHVQQHLDTLDVTDAAVFLCGQSGMVADVTAALLQRGVPAGRIALNLPR